MQNQQSPVHSYKDEKFWYNKTKQTNKQKVKHLVIPYINSHKKSNRF